jgi:hypothetical protein
MTKGPSKDVSESVTTEPVATPKVPVQRSTTKKAPVKKTAAKKTTVPPAKSSTKPTTAGTSGSSTDSRLGVSDAGGAVLALLFWSWMVLPMLQGGPDRMKNVLRAKFFNKGPKGEWLP